MLQPVHLQAFLAYRPAVQLCAECGYMFPAEIIRQYKGQQQRTKSGFWMAKTDLHLQQPASPRKPKAAISEPELIAGPEVVGREISVFQGSIKNPEWWDGRIVDFKADSSQHLVRYHRDHRSEQWIHLSGQPFQWKGSPPPTAAPNPSVKGIKLNDSLLGHKVKVFWPAMSKWYLGCIKGFDPHGSKHTIKYKDGEVKIYALRHEAIRWLDAPDAKTPASPSKSRGHSTSPNTAKAHTSAKHAAHSSGRTCTSGGSSDRLTPHQHRTTAETSHQQSATDLQALESHVKPEGRAKAGANSAAGTEASAAAERDCYSGVFAAASGNADTDAENGYASQHSRRPDAAGALWLPHHNLHCFATLAGHVQLWGDCLGTCRLHGCIHASFLSKPWSRLCHDF